MFKTEIDFSKPYGEVVSQTGKCLVQDGIDFTVHGKRITPVSKEERELAEEIEILKEAKANVAARKKAVTEKKSEVDAEIEAAKPPKPERDDVPNFANMTKAEMAVHAKRFHVDLDQTRLHKDLVTQMKSFYA